MSFFMKHFFTFSVDGYWETAVETDSLEKVKDATSIGGGNLATSILQETASHFFHTVHQVLSSKSNTNLCLYNSSDSPQ